MIDLHPAKCNICNGKVIYTSNAKIYGKEYGSGYCYLCTNCNAYVGTNIAQPRLALGILADKEMRDLKVKAHSLFDKRWHDNKERSYRYHWLAERLGIPFRECHFGYFDKEMLLKAIDILEGEEKR